MPVIRTDCGQLRQSLAESDGDSAPLIDVCRYVSMEAAVFCNLES